MTARQLYEYALIELNKVEAPSLLLEDYNYFINKSVLQYINKAYNAYDMNQQQSDNLRVLKATSILTLTKSTTLTELGDAIYETTLPEDYYHVLNCLVIYNVKAQFKCYDLNSKVRFGAKRLTADMYSQIINNYYMRPSYKRPYFYINNVNTAATKPTNPTLDTAIANTSVNDIEKAASERYGNTSPVKIEIRYGFDSTLFEAQKIMVDYLKTPQYIRLTETQVEATADTSQTLEFPDYVCQEIINELVKLLLENASDPRLQTNMPVNQTIAPPQQAGQAQQPQHRGR